MKVTKHIEFDDTDVDLLKNGVPESPCKHCSSIDRVTCCGCDDYTKYKDREKLYHGNLEPEVIDIVNRCTELYNMIITRGKAEDEMQDLSKELYYLLGDDMYEKVFGERRYFEETRARIAKERMER